MLLQGYIQGVSEKSTLKEFLEGLGHIFQTFFDLKFESKTEIHFFGFLGKTGQKLSKLSLNSKISFISPSYSKF